MFALEIETNKFSKQTKTNFMKNILRQSAIAASLIFALAASSFKANATKLVYERSTNPSIGITVANAVGASFVVKDKKGNIVYEGKVASDKTFYIPTGKLGSGTFQFFIGQLAIQTFIVK
jgi:hypothetical protein